MTIFVSYSRSDATFAEELALVLREIGLRIWIDQDDIPAGARWDSAIEQALRECQSLLAILSPASVKSQNVLDEIGFAIDEGKAVLPVVLSPCPVPLRVRRHQRIAYSGNLRVLAESVARASPASLAVVRVSPSTSARSEELTHGSVTPDSTRLKGGTASQPTKLARPTKAAAPNSIGHPRTINNVVRRRNQKSLELRAVDVALSEIPADMPGERKRLEIQRDKLSGQLAAIQTEFDQLLKPPHGREAGDA